MFQLDLGDGGEVVLNSDDYHVISFTMSNYHFHRENGPAREWCSGPTPQWWLDGVCHYGDHDLFELDLGNGKIVVLDYDYAVNWTFNKYYHRETGPASEWNKTNHWYLNGKRHREDGPAVELADGSKFWFLNGNDHPNVMLPMEM